MEGLIREAMHARGNAACKHSGYAVGAAVAADNGITYRGINIESDSYGLCLCAERCSIAGALAAGAAKFKGMAVATRDG
jgi:cytidine deaminase